MRTFPPAGGAALAYLLSVYCNGIATGFTLSQMNVVLATLGSIYILGEKKTRKEMRHVLTGLASAHVLAHPALIATRVELGERRRRLGGCFRQFCC